MDRGPEAEVTWTNLECQQENAVEKKGSRAYGGVQRIQRDGWQRVSSRVPFVYTIDICK